MPKFTYEAINEMGRSVSGVVEAGSADLALAILSERGYIPTRMSQGKENGKGKGASRIEEALSRVKGRELILFTKQLRTMLRAGIQILTILKVLEAQTENPKMKKTVDAMAMDIKEGNTLYEAFNKHPKVFSPLYCSMIKAGESSGALPEVLDRLTYIIEHEEKIKSDIRSALQYPIIVVVFLGIAFFVLLTFVLPKFVTIFTRANLTLPLPTRLSFMLYNFLADYWYILVGAVVAGVIGMVMYLKTEQGKFVRDYLVMRIPIMGPLFVKSAMSRFASIFSILQSSGINVLESISILQETIGNAAISREFDQIKEQLEGGRGISEPLKAAKYFPPMVINMVAIGEESGNLDDMLHEVSVHYDDEVAYATSRLSEAIGPVLVVGLAAVVGFFALAIFLPMWDLTKMVKPH